MDLPDVPDDFNTEHSSPGNEDKKDDNNSKPEIPKVETKTKTPTKDYISVSELYDMFKTHKDQNCILIIDVRDTLEFTQWKIQHSPTINISHDFIQWNSNLNSVERCLSKDTWEIFNKRFEKKFIIIVDDLFDDTQSPEILATSPALILQEILCKCEAEFSVFVLKGGIQKWVLHYPSMTENPDYNRIVSLNRLLFYSQRIYLLKSVILINCDFVVFHRKREQQILMISTMSQNCYKMYHIQAFQV